MFAKICADRPHWEQKLEQIATATGLHSILIMESLPDSMRVVAANAQEVYHAGDAGPKSVQPGCHELYCERVVNTGQPLMLADASTDAQWQGNEDLVKFGLGVYLGYPLMRSGQAVGTICALNRQSFDFSAGTPSAAERLQALKEELEGTLG